MLEQLGGKKYPEISRDEIVRQLPAMWDKLTKEGLLDKFVKQGFTFQQFVQAAMNEKIKAEQIEMIKNKFNFFYW